MEIFSTKPNGNGITEALAQGAGGSVFPTSMNAFAGILQKAGARFEGDMAALIGKTTLAGSPERAAKTVAGDDHNDGWRDDPVSKQHAKDTHASDRSDDRPDAHRVDRNDDQGLERASDGNSEHNDVNPGERGEHHARNDSTGRDNDTADRSGNGDETEQANTDSGDANTAGENDGGQQSASGKDEQSGSETAATETTDGTASAVSGVQHAEQVLNGLFEASAVASQGSAVASQGADEASSRAATEGPGDNAVQGLTTAINAVTGQTSTQSANGNSTNAQQQGQHGNAHQQAQQAKPDAAPNINANAEALIRTQMETGGNANNGAAQQAAGLARIIGQGNRVSVQVNVTDESAALVSKPSSTLAASVVTSSQSSNDGRTGTQSNANHGQAGAAVAANQANENAGGGINTAQGQQTANQSAQAHAQSLAASASQAKGPAHAGVNPNGAATLPQAVGGEAAASTVPGQTGETQASRQAAASQTANNARPTLPGQSVVDQVSVQITKALQAGMDKINIQLKPGSMGRVEVQLELAQDGRVTAVVTADNKETLEALQRDAKGLEKALLDAGLNTESGDLSFNLRGENAHAENEGSAGSERAAEANAAAEAEGEDLEALLSAGYDEGISADGRVDIRV
jgi:hypothetical protein